MVVLDTSVAYKWFTENEIHRDLAISILQMHLSEIEKILVPDLLFYELSNAWSTKTQIPVKKVVENLEVIYDYKLDVFTADISILKKAAKFSKDYHVSVYDAVYAVLAEENNCELVTADEKFVNQVRLQFVKLLKFK